MNHQVVGLFFLGLIASGCANVATERERATSVVATLLEERTGFTVAARGADDGTIPPEVSDLLSGPLTEEAAVKVALINNRHVVAALARLGVASSELVQAGLLSNPVFSANAKFFSSGTEIELGLVESFLDLFFLPARKRVAESEFEATKVRIVRELVRLTYDVRRSFAGVRAAARLVDVEREVLRAAQASFELMTELHRAGNVTDPELTAEDLALARARLAVSRAEMESHEARETLNALLGLWGDTLSWTVEGVMPEDATSGFDLDAIESRAVAASLDLAEIRALATAEARRIGIVAWEAVLAPAQIGVAAKKEAGSSQWGLGPDVAFSLPVFDAGGARRAMASARLEESLAEHISAAVEIRSAARRLRERTVAHVEQARFIREEELPKARRFVRETLRNYNAMQIGVFQVLIAREREIEAAHDYVETLRDAWMARLDLEELLAGSFSEERAALMDRGSRSHARSSSMNSEQ